jgi:hypothetical protein
MRNTDPDPSPFQPLGEKVTAPAPKPAPPKTIAKGIVQDANGKLRTHDYVPKP